MTQTTNDRPSTAEHADYVRERSDDEAYDKRVAIRTIKIAKRKDETLKKQMAHAECIRQNERDSMKSSFKRLRDIIIHLSESLDTSKAYDEAEIAMSILKKLEG